MTPLKARRQIGKTLKNAARLKTIVAVFARHGFHNIAEKIKLGRFIIEKFSSEDLDAYTTAERLRMAFEQLGPTFVKLGQLLATRPDLVPQEFVDEFKKLHDRVSPLSFEKIEEVLKEELGPDYASYFETIHKEPLASASIAQVHRAKLKDESDIVIKIQRPGITDIINDDLSVLYTLANLLEELIPESRFYNPKSIVDEFFKTLELETNFLVEANNIRRFEMNFKTDPNIKIPHVYQKFSSRRVLIMEALDGIPLSQINSHQPSENYNPEQVVRIGLKCYLHMVFKDGFFHGDLHAGNILILSNNQIGLVDFGVVGRLSRRTKDAIANMMIALSFEDYDRLAYEFVDLAPFSGYVDVDRFSRELRDLMSPYYGLTTKNINMGRLLLDAASIASKHRLSLPSELMLFFKSIVTIEGMAHLIVEDLDLLSYVVEMASELIQAKYEPSRIIHDWTDVARDSTSLIFNLPRQIKQLIRRLSSPDFSVRIRVSQMDDLKRSIERSSNIVFLGLIIGSFILSSSLIMVHQTSGPMPLLTIIGYGLALFLGVVAFFNYIKK